jgi:hypothetical protein
MVVFVASDFPGCPEKLGRRRFLRYLGGIGGLSLAGCIYDTQRASDQRVTAREAGGSDGPLEQRLHEDRTGGSERRPDGHLPDRHPVEHRPPDQSPDVRAVDGSWVDKPRLDLPPRDQEVQPDGCKTTCSGTCKTGCLGTCNTTCQGMCLTSCSGACVTGCTGVST